MLQINPDRAFALDRRRFIIGAAGVATATAWPFRLWAAEAPHSFKQGDFEITVLSDGHLVLPANLLGPDVPAEERKAFLELIGVTGENVEPAASPLLIRTGSDLILFDNGSGSNFSPTAGKLIENMKAAGVDPASITKVVFTHGHPDHMWGTAVEGGTQFPNAQVLLGSGGVGFLERAGHPHDDAAGNARHDHHHADPLRRSEGPCDHAEAGR